MIGSILGDQTNLVDSEMGKVDSLEANSDSYEDVSPAKIPIPQPTSTQPEKDAIASMETALSSYDTIFKQCAPWTNFHQQLQTHLRNKRAYSSRSGELAGQIMEMLLSVDTQYFQATQPLYSWCSETLPLLQGYETLFNSRDKNKIDGQHELLLEILRTDVENSNIALERLRQMFSTLGAASDKLDTLVLQLHDDFADGSQFFKNEINAAQISAKNNITTMALIKQTIKHSIQGLAKFVPEVSFITPFLNKLGNDTDAANPTSETSKLKAEFADIYNFCKTLWTKLNEQATIEFAPIENELRNRIQTVENLKDQISTDGLPRQRQIMTIKSASNSLKRRCKTYRSTYGKLAN